MRERLYPELYGNDNYGKPRMAYATKVWWMTDAQLLAETEHKIWLSSFAMSNSRSDYHWHVSVLYNECDRRGKPELYQQAYDAASGK